MELKTLRHSLRFGIPHSDMIDKILDLRDPNVSIDYYNVYNFTYFNKSEDVLPIFSFGGRIYFISIVNTSAYDSIDDTIFYIGSYEFADLKEIKKENSKAFLFNDLGVSIDTFEHLLFEQITQNEKLIKHLILN